MSKTSISLPLACSLALLGTSLPGQQTIVVDINGGGQFSDLPAAIAAADPGDTLLVAPGTYSSFVLSKGLRIIGGPNVAAGGILSAWSVRNLPAGESVVIREVHTSNPLFSARVSLDGNEGQVHLENLRIDGGVDISDSQQVTLHRVLATGSTPGGAAVTNSSVLFSRSTLQGLGSVGFRTPGLQCSGSDVIFAEGVCRGADDGFRTDPGPGLRIDGGTVTVTGDAGTTVSAGGSAVGIAAPAIDAVSGSLRIDPAVTLVATGGSSAIVGDGTVLLDDIASLRGDVSDDVLSVRIAAPGASQAITVASPPRPSPLPTPFGPFWFMQPLAILDNAPVVAGERSFTRALVPNLPAGTLFVLQAVVVRPTGPDMSMPAVLTLDT